jgi:hypothetical protein
VSSWSFPPAVPCPGAPLPSTGSLGSVPPLHRYCWSTPTPHCPSRFASLPSFSGTAAASLDSLSREVGHLTPVSLDPLLPVALPALCHGDTGVSQVPGRTLARLPSLSLDPGGIAAPGHSRRLDAASAIDTAFGSPNVNLSRLDHAAIALAVYASQCGSPRPTQDSLPAGGQPLPCGTLTRWVRYRRFQVIATSSIPLLQASPGASPFLVHLGRKPREPLGTRRN